MIEPRCSTLAASVNRQRRKNVERRSAHARVGIRDRQAHELVHVPGLERLQRAQRCQADIGAACRRGSWARRIGAAALTLQPPRGLAPAPRSSAPPLLNRFRRLHQPRTPPRAAADRVASGLGRSERSRSMPSTRSRIDGSGHTPSTAIASARISPAGAVAANAASRARLGGADAQVGVDRAADERLAAEPALVQRRASCGSAPAMTPSSLIARAASVTTHSSLSARKRATPASFRRPKRDDGGDAHAARRVVSRALRSRPRRRCATARAPPACRSYTSSRRSRRASPRSGRAGR